MTDREKSKQQLMAELAETRERVAALEESESRLKQAQEALRADEAICRRMVDGLPQMLFLKNADLVYVSCNRAYGQDVGIEPGQIAAKSDYDLYPQDLAEKHRAEDKEIMASGEARVIQETSVRDGKEYVIQKTKAPVRDEHGNVVGVLGIYWDITDIKRAEEARNAYNRSLIEASLDPLVTIAPDGKITDVNSATEKVTGFTREELIGTDFSNYFTQPERARAGYQQVFRDGQVMDYELAIQNRDGAVTPVAYNASVYRDEAGEGIGVFAAARDITERKRVAEAEARAKLAQEILDISTPVMQVWDDVVLTPLIGTLDSQRTQQFMERLLQAIVQTNSEVAVIDITGVPTIDTQTAQHLVETMSAVRLLGARVVLTGVRPPIAQAMVHLGIDLGDVTTRSSLTGGLRMALDMVGSEVVAKNER